MTQKAKIRLVVRERSAGRNMVKQSTLPKSFTDAYHLETGDVLWLSVDHIKRGNSYEKKTTD